MQQMVTISINPPLLENYLISHNLDNSQIFQKQKKTHEKIFYSFLPIYESKFKIQMAVYHS